MPPPPSNPRPTADELHHRLLKEAMAARTVFRSAFAEILRNGVSPELAEAAFPAYAHKNPAIDWIFWGRLRRAFSLLPERTATILDFGCGSGVCSYVAARSGIQVTAIDLNLAPQQLAAQRVEFPAEIAFSTRSLENLADAGEKFDAILALDVLEHVTDYQRTLDLLLGRLHHRGALIISLPTENALYRLGRKLAGREFSGDYHKSKASDIAAGLQPISEVDFSANHPSGVALFRLLRARPKSGRQS